jgi:uncharacterized membrane protein
MGTALRRWDLVINGVFLLLLQLGGINLAAALMFRLFGLSTQGTRYQRGKRGVFPLAIGVSVIGLIGLLIWQFSDSPNLQRSSRAQRANSVVQQVVQQSDLAKLIESDVRFTRADQGQNTLLCVVYVQRQANVAQATDQIRVELTRAIQTRLLQQGFNVTPLVNVTVLEPPAIE